MKTNIKYSLDIPQYIHAQIKQYMQLNFPNEACALLAGIDKRVVSWFPITNILHSPVRYRMDPQEQLDAFITIEKNNWQLLAIVHSHPTGPSHPSPTDIQEAYYPDAIYIIYSRLNNEWQINGYKIIDGDYFPVKIRFTE